MNFRNIFNKNYYSVYFFDIFINLSICIVCLLLVAIILLDEYRIYLGLLISPFFLLLLIYFIAKIFTYNLQIEYLRFSKKTNELSYKKMPKNPGFRVVFVTDQHLHDFLPNKFVNEYMQKINALKPDLLLLGGDFIIDDNTRFNNLDVLSQLGNFPKLAVLGNHDFNIRSLYHQKGSPTKDQIAISKRIIKYLEGFGIKVLENDNYDVNIGNQQKLNIFGLDCLWAKKNDLSKFKASNFNFLLTHHPEIFDNLDDKRFDLVLAGHNHGGGNIKLNQKISVHNFLRLVSKKWKNDFSWHVSGLYKNKYGLKMHLSRGLGLTGLSMRINCPMEVTVIDIV